MSKEIKIRIGSVNSDHLWYGASYGFKAALGDYKESGEIDSTVVAVVKFHDHLAALKAVQDERDELRRELKIQDDANEILFRTVDELKAELVKKASQDATDQAYSEAAKNRGWK